MKFSDSLQPIEVTVLRRTGSKVEPLKAPQPVWAAVTDGTTQDAMIQPVSSQTIQREVGKEVQSTHLLIANAGLPVQAGDRIRILYRLTGQTDSFDVNGRPDQWGTHTEVRLIWLNPTKASPN